MNDFEPRDPLAEYDEHELVFHEGGQITRRQVLLAGGGAIAGAMMGGPLLFTKVASAMPMGPAIKLPYKAHTSVKGHLEFWHFWSSPLRRGAIHTAINQFRSVYKGVSITDLPVPAANIYDKLDAAINAQSGVPDVVISNRLTLWNDAPRNLYVDLTPYNAKDRVSGKVFWPVNWQQCNVKIKGKTRLYALPFETDIRLVFYNRGALVAAGFSPNAAPRTWAQLKSMANKLDKKGGSGFSQITVWPFDLGLDQLVWLNNGDWTTHSDNIHPSANSAANVGAGDWARSYVDRYGGQTGYNQLKSQISNPNLDLFASGIQVFHFDQPTYQQFTLVQNGVNLGVPSNSNPKISKLFPYWGVANLPTSSSKIPPWSFSGGFSVSAPRSKHRSSGATAAAWEFIKFMSLVGQLTFEQYAGNIPTVISQAHSAQVSNKPNWGRFLAALKYQHKLTQDKYDVDYPGTPVANAQTHITSGSQTAKQALDAVQSEVEAIIRRNGGP